MVNISIDVTDLGGEARPGDKVVFWRPRMGGSATHAGRVISTAPVTVFLTDGKATVPDVEPGEMAVLLQCRGVESQGPVTVGVPDGDHTVTLRALLESQFEYAPPIVSAVQEAASNASASEEAAIQAQVRSEAAADRADAKVDDAINNGANLVRNEVKQDADRAVSARQAATQSESNAAASEGAAASSASKAKTSEANAKQSETNAGDYAAVATTAATEAVDAMTVASEAAASIGDSVSRAAASADSASQSEINAAQYESSAATHAQNATEAATKVGTAAELEAWASAAQEAADRVGTAEQVGTWASESSAAASRAEQAETNAKASEEAAASSAVEAGGSRDSAVASALEAGSYVDAVQGYSEQAGQARDEVVPLAGQVSADASATAAHRVHVDNQVSAIDTAFTESIPPYLQTDSPNGLRATYALSEQREVNVFHKGVSPLNSPEDNLAAFQAAIDEAPDGATIVMPSTSPNEVVHISGSITPRPGMTLSGIGGRAYLAQETWGTPVFDLPYGEVTLRHWDVRSVPDKSAISGAFRDGSATNAATVVWLGGHRGHLDDIRGQGFTSVCRATPWDEQSGTLGEISEGHIFENIEVAGCDWGIVGSGWSNATLHNITGVYNTRDGSGDPGHLIYISSQRQSRDVMISDCMAFNGTGGRAYSFKNVDGMDVTSITARSCEGLMDYTAMKNVRWSGLRALDDRDDTQQGCIYGFGGDDNSFMRVSDVFLEIHPLARAIRVDGIEGVWRDITILVSREKYSDTSDIDVHGEGNTLQGVYVYNRSAFSHRFINVIGPRNRILAPRAYQTSVVTTLLGSATETVVEYDPAASTLNKGAPVHTYLGNASPTAIVRITPTIQRVTTAGGTVRGYSSGFSIMQISVTGAGAVTIMSPYDRPNDNEVTYEITNDTDAAMGGLTFVGTHVTNNTVPPPAPGDTHSITFRYDGVENLWREVRRAIAPTPDTTP